MPGFVLVPRPILPHVARSDGKCIRESGMGDEYPFEDRFGPPNTVLASGLNLGCSRD